MGKKFCFPCRGQTVCVTAELLAIPFHLPSSPWKKWEESNWEEKGQTVWDALFPCACTALGENCPKAGIRSTSSQLKMQANLASLEAPWGAGGAALWRQPGTRAELLRVRWGTAKSASLGTGEKHPMHEFWVLGNGLYGLGWWSCCRQQAFTIYPPERKKRLKRATAEDLSLHRPLAPSSVLLLETQTEMLISVLPFALLPPTTPIVFEWN